MERTEMVIAGFQQRQYNARIPPSQLLEGKATRAKRYTGNFTASQQESGQSGFLKNFYLFNWKLITLQDCSGFCHTST